MLAERSNRQKGFLVKMCDIENDFIDELYNSRSVLSRKYYLGDFEDKYLRTVD